MQIKFSKLFLLGILCLTLIAVHAALPESSGMYFEGNAGIGALDTAFSFKSLFSSTTQYKPMGNVNVGYKFTDKFAFEAGFTWFPNVTIGDFFYRNNYMLDAAVKGIYPFDNGFDVFAKIGIGIMHSKTGISGNDIFDEDNTETVGFFAFGTGYAFTPNVSGTLQLISTPFGNDVPSMLALAVGITYIFPQ